MQRSSIVTLTIMNFDVVATERANCSSNLDCAGETPAKTVRVFNC